MNKISQTFFPKKKQTNTGTERKRIRKEVVWVDKKL